MNKSRRRSFVTITTATAIISSCCNPSCPRDREKALNERPEAIAQPAFDVPNNLEKDSKVIASYPNGKSLNFIAMVNSQNVLYVSGHNSTNEWFPLDIVADDVSIGPSGLFALRKGGLFARTNLNEDDYGREWKSLGGQYAYIHSSSVGLFLISNDGKVFLAPLNQSTESIQLDSKSFTPIQISVAPSEISYHDGFLWIVSKENRLYRSKFDTSNKNISAWQEIKHSNQDLKINSFSASKFGLWLVDKQGRVYFLQEKEAIEATLASFEWQLIQDDSAALDSSSAIICGANGVWLLRGDDIFLRLHISSNEPMGTEWKAIGLKGLLAFDNGI